MAESFNIDLAVEELELDREDVVELLGNFRDYLKEELPKLVTACESGNMEDARGLSHAMKGSSGNLRVNGIYDITLQMQKASEDGDQETVMSLLDKLKKEADLFLKESETI